MAITKKEWDKIDSKFNRYARIIGEDFRSQIKPVVEMQQEQGKKIDKLDKKVDKMDGRLNKMDGRLERVEEKADITFEMVGELTKTVNEVQKNIEIMKSDLSFIKQELKHKVDRDEFETLEKRVIFLEKKISKV